jgi:hypothetical protein
MLLRKIRTTILAYLAITAGAAGAWCQKSPLELASMVTKRWAGTSEADFGAAFPFREGREVFSETAQAQFDRRGGLAKVIHEGKEKAVLLISGVPLLENSGDATIESRGFSGFYEARKEGGRWALASRIPLDGQGRILAHRLSVRVRPADGLDVEDRMRIRAQGNNGFAIRLNYRAKVRQVKVDNTAVHYLFGGGLLWVDMQPGEATLTITYSISVEEGPNETNSGCFLRKAGHVRNQYFWHPFFDFNSAGDQAVFEIEARIPKEYKLSTSLPQTEQIEGAQRVIEGKTIRPTFALTLVYDRDWKTVTEQVGNLRLELFLTPEFKPFPAAVIQEFQSVYSLLSSRFGVPKAAYFGIVQARSVQGNGWLFASNEVVVAGGWPRIFSTKDGFPRAFLGHEIGHLWMNGSGPAANFLGEGWATYVESLVLAREFGADTEKQFWKKEAEAYFGDYDGKVSILEDESNSGVSYSKGAWVFRMLNEAVGEEAFGKAMTEYSSRSLAQAAGWDVLAECFQRQAKTEDFDARAFLTPWLREKSVPRITAEINGDQVILHQAEPAFILPVTVEATTPSGIERRTAWIRGDATVLRFDANVAKPQVDPDGLVLLRR